LGKERKENPQGSQHPNNNEPMIVAATDEDPPSIRTPPKVEALNMQHKINNNKRK